MANGAPPKRQTGRSKGPTPKGPSPKASSHGTGAKARPNATEAQTAKAGSAKAGSARPSVTAVRAAKPGRFTPKSAKTPSKQVPAPTDRYTPPIPRNKRSSPPWVPVLMLSLLVLGALVIICDYLGVLPYSPTAWYLLVGLVLVAAGFGVATQYR